MRQESGLKRLVFSLGVNHHFINYIEWGDSIYIEILKLAFNRGFAFRGHSELANRTALIGASGEWTINLDMSSGAAVEA